MSETTDAMCELAARLATEAGEIALSRFGEASVDRKEDKSVVTDVDHAIQAHILNAVAEAFPDHGVRAEEVVAQPGAHADSREARYVWVIDPLDGTRNYVAGFPLFATAIAVLDRGVPVVGVVREHNRRDLYCARSEKGATRNGEKLSALSESLHGDMLIGVASGRDPMTVDVLRYWAATPGFVVRNTGSTANHLALVGAGVLSGAFGHRVKLWDIAAGALLVEEAGGRISDPHGEPLTPFDLSREPKANVPYLAAAPGAHERLLASIREAYPNTVQK